MSFVSYAQNFEDVLLWRALGTVRQGFYIDVGAWHPDVDSVTRAFYDRGWYGINVEPGDRNFERLAASRPRDTNLHLAAGPKAGAATFYALDEAVSGSSSLDPAILAESAARGWAVHETTIRTETLAAICERHAPPDIHFLKIDVEGYEREVLQGADFARFRPWIVVVEATEPMSQVPSHGPWDHLLLSADYRFAWFDGLNRFYIAAEHHAALSGHLQTPPNVFDDFVRAADAEWASRVGPGGSPAETQAMRAARAELRAGIAEDRSERAHLRLARVASEVDGLRADLGARTADLARALASGMAAQHTLRDEVAVLEQARSTAERSLRSVHQSTSWRVTGPLRQAVSLARRAAGGRTAQPPKAAPEPGATPAPMADEAWTVRPATAAPERHGRLGSVHQFHSGSAAGDAITNAMVLTQNLLRQLGYDSRIFVEHRDPAFASEFLMVEDLPDTDDYVLIVRHSMGYDRLGEILSLRASKILLYHNITPPELLPGMPMVQEYARRGRDQLALLRPKVAASLADSAYNALELVQAGFDPVSVCPLLFDVALMTARAPARTPGPVFTILFVGRIAASKGQRELVAAFAQFRCLFPGQSRMVLVGRHDGGGDPYLADLLAFIRANSLDTGQVEITGLVSDAELGRRYAEADLFVSPSSHEGFGVPLVEAMAHGVPVLACASGAVPDTVRDSAMLVPDPSPGLLAEAMLALASNPAARQRLVARAAARLPWFGLERHTPALVEALLLAGAARPADLPFRAALATQARFVIAGHVNGSYSLAEVNRALALALESERPGAVRIIAVEGAVTTEVAGIPPLQRQAVGALLARPAPLTGPEIVISQHYPVWAPPRVPHRVALALFFWEESLVDPPTVDRLNAGFAGVLAPSRSVAKALVDSGVTVPVRLIGLAPRLDRFSAVGKARRPRPAGAPFTFLHVSSCFPRKGVDVLLQAYATAFRRSDPVRLLVKGFPNPHNTVREQVAALQAADDDAPAIECIDRDLDADALLDLYRHADVMVLPTRGEGYNLPAAEALAAGLRLIVTAWGGHMDMLADVPDGLVRLLAFRFGWSGSHLTTPGSVWAEPDMPDLVQALRQAVAQPPAGPAAWDGPAPALAEPVARFAAELLLPFQGQAAPRVGWITTWNVPCGIAGYARQLIDQVELPATVFADLRTAPAAQTIPSWKAGDTVLPVALIRAILQENPPVIVLQHQPGLFPWSMLAGFLTSPALAGRVVCVALHNSLDLFDAAPEVRSDVLRALGRVSRVVVHTLVDLNRLAGAGLGQNLVLIPQGAPPAAAPAPVRTLTPASEALIGCYGFFLPGKGIAELIEAFGILRTRWPSLKLRLVNAAYPLAQSTDLIDECRAAVQRLGLTDAVQFETGFLADTESARLLRDCDLVCLPHRPTKEASSASLRSAFASGVPIAVTPAAIFDEASGVVIALPGITAAEMADGLERALLDDGLRRTVADAGHAWTAERAWPTVARRWTGLLKGLTASAVTMA